MKTLCLVIFVLAIRSLTLHGSESQSIQTKALNGDDVRPLLQTPALREELISNLRSIAASETDYKLHEARQALINLSDPETTQNAIADYHGSNLVLKRKAIRLLRNSKAISVIPMIVSDTFVDEKFKYLHEEDILVPPISFLSTEIIIHVLSSSSEVQPRVQAWAKSLGKLDADAQRNSVRTFWNLNAGKFSTSQYEDLVVPP